MVAWILTVAVGALARAQDYSDDERSHWSFLPRTRPPVPALTTAEAAWAATPVDAFLLARLREAGLTPAPPADRPTLIRRLTLHLTGLPPTPDEIRQFAADRAPDADERLIDRLLASPHYGETWGQHWLDVVRYAESEGFEYDRHRPGAWRFRDYVIESFNRDLPFDQFVVEQLAGDELAEQAASAPPAVAPAAEKMAEWQVAAGFHRLGLVRRNAGNSDVAFSRNEVLTDMTDAIGYAFLGLTVGCARCHDHMFDPIHQSDYYHLQAFLAATQEHDVRLGNPETVKRWTEQNDQVQAEIKRLRELLDDAEGDQRDKLTAELRAAQKRLPPPLPTISSVHNDAAQRSAIHVLVRGDTEKPQQRVGPRPLGVLLPPGTPELPADVPQPKLALARWLVDPAHPLTARVLVNRLWHYLFGRGLVATPNDFGVNGAAPSHPQLLDYLAEELVAGGWSVKRIQRQIVTSAAYRQSSRWSPGGLQSAEASRAALDARRSFDASTLQSSHDELPPAADNPQSAVRNLQSLDPDNELLWHFPRRRLTAEQIRDAMLAVSGRLNASLGGESILLPVKKELVDLLYDPAQWVVTPDPRQHDRRSVYLVAKRNLRLPFLEVFDQPDLQISCPRRQSSTHAPQALELLNGEIANDLAAALADRLRSEAGTDAAAQVERAFWLALGRPPQAAERRLALDFLRSEPLEELALAMLNLNAFLYVD